MPVVENFETWKTWCWKLGRQYFALDIV